MPTGKKQPLTIAQTQLAETAKRLGPTHGASARWKIVDGPGSSFRVEPASQCRGIIIFCIAWAIICSVGVWFIPSLGFKDRVFISYVSPLIMTAFIAGCTWMNANERKLGPHLTFDGKYLTSRISPKLAIADIRYLSVLTQSEEDPFGDVEIPYQDVTYLKATLKDGGTAILIYSTSERAVAEVGQRLTRMIDVPVSFSRGTVEGPSKRSSA